MNENIRQKSNVCLNSLPDRFVYNFDKNLSKKSLFSNIFSKMCAMPNIWQTLFCNHQSIGKRKSKILSRLKKLLPAIPLD